MVIRVILKRSGSREPQTEPSGFQGRGGFDVIGNKTPSARCQQIIGIHPIESQPIRPFWATNAERTWHAWLSMVNYIGLNLCVKVAYLSLSPCALLQ